MLSSIFRRFRGNRDSVPPAELAPWRDTIEKLLLFIGSPRTGSTLLGQILNYHPQCLVATEARLVTQVVMQGVPLDEALARTVQAATHQFEQGLVKDEKFGPTLGRFQPQWVPFEELAHEDAFRKRGVKLIGDKKAGASTQAFLDKPDEMLALLESEEKICLLQLVRHPVDAARSYMRSHEIDSFDAACEEIVMKTHVAYQLGRRVDNPHCVVYYEALTSMPSLEIRRLLDWLELECSESWLDEIARRVASVEKKRSQADIAVAERIVDALGAQEVLGDYFSSRKVP